MADMFLFSFLYMTRHLRKSLRINMAEGVGFEPTDQVIGLILRRYSRVALGRTSKEFQEAQHEVKIHSSVMTNQARDELAAALESFLG
jgi:hypothetical protein